MKKYIIWIVTLLSLSIYTQSSMSACNNVAGYTVLKSATGVEMCGNGNTVVQTIDLAQGAGIKSLYNEPTIGVDGVERFEKMPMSGYTLKSFATVNGTFFDGSVPPKLTFAVKENNRVLTKGYTKSLILGISGTSPYITTDTGDYTPYTQVIGGYSTATPVRATEYIGRNIVGTNGSKLYILITNLMRTADADALIKKFGAVKTMQLDGSGSAQLKSDVKNILSSDSRAVPHMIAVLSKPQQDVVVKMDKCLIAYPSYFGKKVGLLHSDCGSSSVYGQLYCQATSAGKTDQTKARKIGISFQPNPTSFWDYTDLYLWRSNSLTKCP